MLLPVINAPNAPINGLRKGKSTPVLLNASANNWVIPAYSITVAMPTKATMLTVDLPEPLIVLRRMARPLYTPLGAVGNVPRHKYHPKASKLA